VHVLPSLHVHEHEEVRAMNRLPGIPEDVLMQFATVVVVAMVVVAFAAYVGTWIAAWRHQRKTATGTRPVAAEGSGRPVSAS
jgi:hypothetical protein